MFTCLHIIRFFKNTDLQVLIIGFKLPFNFREAVYYIMEELRMIPFVSYLGEKQSQFSKPAS